MFANDGWIGRRVHFVSARQESKLDMRLLWGLTRPVRFMKTVVHREAREVTRSGNRPTQHIPL